MKYILAALSLLLLQIFFYGGYNQNYFLIITLSLIPIFYFLFYKQKLINLIPVIIIFLVLRLLLLINYNSLGSDDISLNVSFINSFYEIDKYFLLNALSYGIYYYPITLYYVSIPKIFWGSDETAILAFNFFHLFVFLSLLISIYLNVDKRKITQLFSLVLLNPIFLLVTSNLGRDIYIFIGLILLVAYLYEASVINKTLLILFSVIIFALSRVQFLALVPFIILLDYIALTRGVIKTSLIFFITVEIILTASFDYSIFYLLKNIVYSLLSPFPWYDLKSLTAVTNNYGDVGIAFIIFGSILNIFILTLFSYLLIYFKKLNVKDKKLILLTLALLFTLQFADLAFNRYLMPAIIVMSIVVVLNKKFITNKIIFLVAIFSIFMPIFINALWYFIR